MFIFFLKQKTAYEMRISDWSSDVCSSDLTLVIDLLKVSADGFGASLDLCKAVDTIGGAVASSEKIVNPVLEIHPPGNVDAQHLGDHTDRKQRGKFPDEIELALAAMLPDDIIDQFMRDRSEEHTSELQSLMRISYAVF